MYYALTDAFTGDDPKECTYGFANTKAPLAFKSRAARDRWVRDTKLMTAKALSRDEVLRMTDWERGEHVGSRSDRVKAVAIYGATGEHGDTEYHIIAAKNY